MVAVRMCSHSMVVQLSAVDTQIRRTHHGANALLNSNCIKRKRSTSFKAFKGVPPYVTSLLQPSEASVKS